MVSWRGRQLLVHLSTIRRTEWPGSLAREAAGRAGQTSAITSAQRSCRVRGCILLAWLRAVRDPARLVISRTWPRPFSTKVNLCMLQKGIFGNNPKSSVSAKPQSHPHNPATHGVVHAGASQLWITPLRVATSCRVTGLLGWALD